MTKIFLQKPLRTVKNNNGKTGIKWPGDVSSAAVHLSIISALYYFYRIAVEFPSVGLDYINIWCTARLALSGKIMALYDLANLRATQMGMFSKNFLQYYLQNVQNHIHSARELMVPDYVWAYPPHVLPWIAGFGLFPYPVALGLWLALTYALYAFAVAYKRPQPWWLALVLIAAPASCENIDVGYTGFLIAAFLAGGLRLLDKRPIFAGILFGFLTFKPQFAVLVPIALLAGCHWRALAAAILTTGVLVGLSVFLFGSDPWLAYLHVIMPYQKTVIEASLGGDKVKTILMVTPFMAARFIGASLPLAYGLAGLFLAGAAIAVVHAFRRPAAPDLRNAVMLTAVFFATPYAFVADMTMLSAAIVFMLAAINPRSLSLGEKLLLMAAWMLPAFVALFNFARIPAVPLILAGLLGLQLWWIMRLPRTSSKHKITVNSASG